MKPTISIIVSIFNRKDELTELLKSLVNQSDMDFEVIIIDDGSSVDLPPTIQDFENNLNISYYKKENTGPGLSRNFGAKKAKNEWLVFVDSDVIVEKNYIQNIKNNLQNTPCDAFGGADKAHPNFNTLQKAISYTMTSILTTGGIRGSKKIVNKFQPRSFNMGVLKTTFDAVNGFSEMRIGEDPDLSIRLWENGFSTAFFDDISVYHKRRTDLKKFAKQVYQFGCARPILNQRHPKYVKISFLFPSIFTVGFLASIFIDYILETPLFISFYAFYTLLILFHSLKVTHNLKVALYSCFIIYIQMSFYGLGFLNSWIKLNLLKMNPKNAFPKHFYQN